MKTPTPLSHRESAVISSLARFRFLSTAQIERFLFRPEDRTTPDSRKVITHRILKRLAERSLIERASRAVGGPGGGSAAHAYFLTPEGSKVTSLLGSTSSWRRGAPRGTFLLRHALGVADVALAFLDAASGHEGHELLSFECDWEIAQRIGSETLVPDAFLIYASATLELHAFLEVDLGTAGSRFFQQKIERYLELYRSNAWARSLRLWPTVLTVAPTETRAALLKRATKVVLSGKNGDVTKGTEFAFASLPLIVAEGPLACVWTVAGCSGRHTLLPNQTQTERGA